MLCSFPCSNFSSSSALINHDSIKAFDEENWTLFKGKCSAPKFKAALVEARKLTRQSIVEPTTGKIGADVLFQNI